MSDVTEFADELRAGAEEVANTCHLRINAERMRAAADLIEKMGEFYPQIEAELGEN